MPNNEMSINHLITCINELNRVEQIPAAEELKQLLNGWVEKKVKDALQDPIMKIKLLGTFIGYNTGESSDPLINWLIQAEKIEGAGVSELKDFIREWVQRQIDSAVDSQEWRMIFLSNLLRQDETPQNTDGDNVIVDNNSNGPNSSEGDHNPHWY